MPEIRALSKVLAKKAQEELNEKPEEIKDQVKALRNWIQRQPHLKARTDDQFLVAFLRGSKYNMELAKQKIDLFFTMRTILPEITQNRDIRFGTNAELLKLGSTIPLPMTQGEDGPRIFLIRPGQYDPKKYTMVDVFRIFCLYNDYLLMNDDNFIVGGQVGILDLTNVTNEHFMQFKPEFVKKMTLFNQEASPIRPKGFHYIHTPDGFEYVFNMFKSFMSEENRKLLYVHGSDLESLYRHVNKRFLPTEYGGEAGTIQSLIDDWEKKLVGDWESLKEWEKYGSNELNRAGPPITEETIMLMPDVQGFMF